MQEGQEENTVVKRLNAPEDSEMIRFGILEHDWSRMLDIVWYTCCDLVNVVFSMLVALARAERLVRGPRKASTFRLAIDTMVLALSPKSGSSITIMVQIAMSSCCGVSCAGNKKKNKPQDINLPLLLTDWGHECSLSLSGDVQIKLSFRSKDSLLFIVIL